MLKGHTFNLQTFTSEAWAVFCNNFLNDSSGILKGCELSNTNNSVTIAEGYFVIKGRLLQIISSETISNISNNDGYYSLVCEIDLSKINTTSELNQAVIKTLYNASAYPTLTQQDITGSGTVYQYEFARFKVESGTITNFTDRRGNVIDNTYKLKGDFKLLTGSATMNEDNNYSATVSYPEGFTESNSVVISFMEGGEVNLHQFRLIMGNSNMSIAPLNIQQGMTYYLNNYKIILMKTN